MLRVICFCLALWAIPVHSFARCLVTSDAGDVHSEHSLAYYIQRIVEHGDCRSSDTNIRNLYSETLSQAEGFHLIEWDRAMTIPWSASLQTIASRVDTPLILRVRTEHQVVITGSTAPQGTPGITVNSGSAPVIIDGLTFRDFPSTALHIAADDTQLHRIGIFNSGGLAGTSTPQPALTITGRGVHIANSTVANNHGTGIYVGVTYSETPACDLAQHHHGASFVSEGTAVRRNAKHGYVIHAKDGRITDGDIHGNAGHGIWQHVTPLQERCGTMPQPDAMHGVLIDQSSFYDNGAKAIAADHYAYPSIADIIAVTPPHSRDIVVIGNMAPVDSESIWQRNIQDPTQLTAAVYLHAGEGPGSGLQYLADAPLRFEENVQFTLTLTREMLDGLDVSTEGHLPLVAHVRDHEHMQSSAFSAPSDVITELDWDRDGLLNADEDANHDGIVNGSETDPRLADSDSDGLTDGEEHKLNGRIEARMEAQPHWALHDPHNLDPRNADSDGDCLPDGLELSFDHIPDGTRNSAAITQPRLELGARCRSLLQERQVFSLPHGEPWDTTAELDIDNLRSLRDVDPLTQTDPTNPDSDNDGLDDGIEDWNLNGARDVEHDAAAGAIAETLLDTQARWIESDPQSEDSDQDGLRDGDEAPAGTHDSSDAQSANVLSADTDGDGVSDADEVQRHGTAPNACDSDGDGLSDGVELLVVHPLAAESRCNGLQSIGTNFASPGVLQPMNPDSDGDRLPDGDEDRNHNGWLDPDETDPSTSDSDYDGIPDYREHTGDFDDDGIIDINLSAIANGGGCAPPLYVHDLDCDGLINARDTDSDNDGCSDHEEGMHIENGSGIPAAYDSKVKRCGAAASSSGASSGSANTASSEGENAEPATTAPAHTSLHVSRFSKMTTGGGSCSLLPQLDTPSGSR